MEQVEIVLTPKLKSKSPLRTPEKSSHVWQQSAFRLGGGIDVL